MKKTTAFAILTGLSVMIAFFGFGKSATEYVNGNGGDASILFTVSLSLIVISEGIKYLIKLQPED